jgi:hypothetical protein
MKKIFFLFIIFLNIKSQNVSNYMNKTTQHAHINGLTGTICPGCLKQYDESGKKVNDLESQCKEHRLELAKWMKMYQALQESYLSMLDKWMKTSASLAEKLITLSQRYSK